MDKEIAGQSAVIPVYVKNDGTVSSAKSDVASHEQYEKLKRHIKRAITEIGEEILSGNVEIKPIRNGDITPCSYGRYRSICGFDINVHPCRYPEKISSDDEIWQRME